MANAIALPGGIELLTHARSASRRSGAKKLRKLADTAAGPALLSALKNEVKDPRTWETQYQMIMGLGECDYRDALPYLHELSKKEFKATMVYVALGDAIVRLSRQHPNDAGVVPEILRSGNHMLAEGALQAVAMLRMVPEEKVIVAIIEYALSFSPEEVRRYGRWSWPLAGAPGWLHVPIVKEFLDKCAKSDDEENRQLALAALGGRYQKLWKVL